MKTKPLDANTSSMHERRSWTPACQSPMENTNDAAPSNSDNSTLKDAMSSNPDADADEESHEEEEGNSSQTSHKLLNLHFHSNFGLQPYPQLQQTNIQLLLMSHTVH